MAENALFRKSALEKLASPERLDVLMQVTSPQGWIALWTVGIVLAIAVGWSLFGSWGERVSGQGLLIRGEGNRLVRAGGSGRLDQLLIRKDDLVSPGQEIGRIHGATMNQEMTAARASLDAAEAEHSRTVSLLGQERLSNQSRMADLDSQLVGLKADAAAQERRRSERQQALKQKIISQNQYDLFLSSLRALQQQVNSAQDQRRRLDLRSSGIDGEMAQSEARLGNAKRTYELLVAQMGSATTIVNSFAGRVVNLPKRENDQVQRGDVIAVVEETKAPLRAAIFVPDRLGPQVKEGMQVQIDLSPTVQREQYGVLLGTVYNVGSYAATPDEVLAILGESQARDFLQGGKFLVRVELTPDTSTPTGFAWSSSSGPSREISGGMYVSGDVMVTSRRPICRILPVGFLCGS